MQTSSNPFTHYEYWEEIELLSIEKQQQKDLEAKAQKIRKEQQDLEDYRLQYFRLQTV